MKPRVSVFLEAARLIAEGENTYPSAALNRAAGRYDNPEWKFFESTFMPPHAESFNWVGIAFDPNNIQAWILDLLLCAELIRNQSKPVTRTPNNVCPICGATRFLIRRSLVTHRPLKHAKWQCCAKCCSSHRHGN